MMSPPKAQEKAVDALSRRFATLAPPTWREVAAVATLAAVPLFFRVQIPPIYWWDEARVALNALEMMHASNPLVVTLGGLPDLWNPKPPLATWLTACSMRLFGINEFALRLPSVLAAVATVVAVYLFTRRVSGSRAVSSLAALILLGTGGYYQIHVARTADYDSLLVLFMTLSTFRLFFAIDRVENEHPNPRDFYAAAAFAACALLAKGVAGLLMLPGYALYAVVSGKLRALVAYRPVWVSAASVLLAALLFLGAREVAQPGFVHAMWHEDVITRFGAGWDRHFDSPLYYVEGLLWPWQLFWLSPPAGISTAQSAFPWSWLLPAAAVLGLCSRDKPTARASRYLLCCLAGFLVMLSAAQTKIAWYVAPAYPLIAVVTALGIGELWRKMRNSGTQLLHLIGSAVLPAGITLGAATVVANVAKTERGLTGWHYSDDRQLHYFLKSLASEHPAFSKLRIVRAIRVETPVVVDGRLSGSETYDGPVRFYAVKLRHRIPDVQVVPVGYSARPGEIIIGCGERVRADYPEFRVLKKGGRCFALADAAVEAPKVNRGG